VGHKHVKEKCGIFLFVKIKKKKIRYLYNHLVNPLINSFFQIFTWHDWCVIVVLHRSSMIRRLLIWWYTYLWDPKLTFDLRD